MSSTVSTSGSGAPHIAKLEYSLRGQYLLTDYEAPFTLRLHTPDFVDGAAPIGLSAILRDGTVSDPASLDLSFDNNVDQPPGPEGSYTPPSAPPATRVGTANRWVDR